MRISGLPDRADWRTVKDFLRDQADPAFVDNIMNGEGKRIGFCIFIYLSIYISIYFAFLSICAAVCLAVYVVICPRFHLSIFSSIHQSLNLPILFTFHQYTSKFDHFFMYIYPFYFYFLNATNILERCC